MRIIKKILIWSTITFLLFVGMGIGITIFYADKVEGLVISELNEKLSRPVQINNISFSFFSKFPKASVEIETIVIEGIKKEDKPFITAEKLYLSFNLMSLLKDEMVINEITVEDATVRIHKNKQEQVNYLIFKEKKDKTAPGILNIEEVNLINTKILYEDKTTNIKVKTHSFNSSIKANLADEQSFNCKWDGVVNRLVTKSYNVENIPVKGAITVKVTDDSILYAFLKGKIITLPITIEGTYDRIEKLNYTRFDLKKGDIKQIVLLLDNDTQKDLIKHKLSGYASAKGIIKDLSTSITSLNGNFKTYGASVQLNENFHVQGVDINSDLNWKNIRQLDNANFSIKDFLIKSTKSELRGSGTIRGLKKLSSSLHLEGSIDISDLVDKLSKNELAVSSGKFIFNSDIEAEFGALLKNKNTSFENFKSVGDIGVENLSFTSKTITERFSKINGKIHFDNDKILLKDFIGKVNSSSFTLDGYIYDYLKEDETLSIDAKLTCDKVILEEFIDDKSQLKTDSIYSFNFPKNLNLKLAVAVENFSFRKFKANQLKGGVVLANQVLNFNPILLNSCEGTMSINGRIIARSKRKVFYEGKINLEEINIKTAFYQMENFGQDFLLDKHLSGTLNSSIYLHAQSDKELNMNLKKLFVEAKVNISKGELTQFEPMIDLQEFLKEEFKISLALDNLKFKTLKNTIEISNEVIKIPEMEIASSGINLKVSGNHSFKHEINYLFKVKNKEIFKAKRQNSIDEKYGVIENSDKTSTLPLLMTGTVDEPKFSYDIKTKKQIVKENWIQEGKDIKSVLKKEINEIMGKKNPPKKKESTTKIKVIWDDED